MGDITQFAFLKKTYVYAPARVLEVGSLVSNYATTFRKHFAESDYVGIDLVPGEGVDHIVDLLDADAMSALGHFDLIICTSVLEHVKKPWVAAEHLTKALKPGGHIYIAVPWVWRYHPYPDDYFRFSFAGIREIFPDINWTTECYATNLGEIVDVAKAGAQFDNRSAYFKKTPRGERKYLPYLQLLMLGALPEAAA